MILRQYKGYTKRVGRQQVASMILINAVKRISPDFSILKEARREVLEDLMDIENTGLVLEGIEQKKIQLEEIHTPVPSPFAFNLVIQGYTDVMKIEDKVEFIRRMHKNIIAKLSIKKGIDKEALKEFSYHEEWDNIRKKSEEQKDEKKEMLKQQAWNLERVPLFAKQEIVELIDGKDEASERLVDAVHKYKKEIEKDWPEEVKKFVFGKVGIERDA